MNRTKTQRVPVNFRCYFWCFFCKMCTHRIHIMSKRAQQKQRKKNKNYINKRRWATRSENSKTFGAFVSMCLKKSTRATITNVPNKNQDARIQTHNTNGTMQQWRCKSMESNKNELVWYTITFVYTYKYTYMYIVYIFGDMRNGRSMFSHIQPE